MDLLYSVYTYLIQAAPLREAVLLSAPLLKQAYVFLECKVEEYTWKLNDLRHKASSEHHELLNS